ncbi:MAG: DMT family transporter [Clostridia bacterium]|nr:DMT family transporter [Clostridia bacterium]
MWIVFSILTVLLWGTSETIFKSVSNNERNTVLKLIAYNGIIYGIVSVLYMLITKTEMNLNVIITYLPIAAVYIASMFCTYKAMRLVKVSILSPIQNSSCVFVTILCMIVLHQQVEWYQLMAVGFIIVGIILLSINKDETIMLARPDTEKAISKSAAYMLYLKGLAFALGYMVLDAIGGFLDENVLEADLSENQVIVAYALIYLIVGLICLGYLVFSHKTEDLFNFKEDKKKLIGSLVETAGQFTYIYAFAFGDAALASPFIAAYSAVTIILSRIFLKEKLKLRQYAMLALVFVGMIILSIEG